MNLAYREADVAIFWSQLESALHATFTGSPPSSAAVEVDVRSPDAYYAFHDSLIADKLARLGATVDDSSGNEEAVLLRRQAARAAVPRLRPAGPSSWTAASHPRYRDRVLALQAEIYEPARQSSAAEFDAVFADENPLAMLILEGDAIVAMAFAGPLNRFRHLRGVSEDPYVDDPAVAYMLDLTVIEPFRGRLGRVGEKGDHQTRSGPRRDGDSRSQSSRSRARTRAINLSLGSYPTQYLVDDYPDNEPFRDCIYYRCPTQWSEPPIDLAGGITACRWAAPT